MDDLVLDERVLVESDFDLDDLLDEVAGQVRPAPLREAFFGDAEPWLEEAFWKKPWQKEKHPRWPPGTKNAAGENIGGQFMHVGQRFMMGGLEWEVSQVGDKKFFANVATGTTGQAATQEFKATKDPDGGYSVDGITPSKPYVIKGGKNTQASNTPVVDPYVDASTHDPSLPIPADTTITPEEWKRFGKIDQENLIDCMERFGKWKAGAATSLWNTIMKEYDSTLQQIVKQAMKSQAGSSSGWTVSLTAMFKGGSYSTEKAFELRERAKELQADLASVVQWDLYNRTNSPDVAIFHKTGDSPSIWINQFMKGGKAVFSGLSQSTHYRHPFWDSYCLATPMSIRHIIASENSVHWSSFGMAENEAMIADEYKIDERTLAFTPAGGYGTGEVKLTPQQDKWLQGVTKSPKGGHVIADLIANMKGLGTLDIPPSPPNVVMSGSGGKQYNDPPPGAAEATKGWKLPAESTDTITPEAFGALKKAGDFTPEFAWPDDDHGGPTPMPASEQGFSPGDYMIGKRGAFYWVGADPGAASGLRYWKIVDGVFTGESWELDNNRKAYKLFGPGGMTFPEPPAAPEKGVEGFNPDNWINGKDEEFVGKLKKGQKFKVNGVYYELQADGSMMSPTVQIKALTTGKLATINTDYKTAILQHVTGNEADDAIAAAVPSGPQYPEGAEVLVKKGASTLVGSIVGPDPDTPGNLIISTLGELGVSYPSSAIIGVPKTTKVGPDAPAVGDTFGWAGKKYTVTNILKNGTVKAKPTGGKVAAFKPEDVTTNITFFRPDDWLHDPGQKVKLGALEVGDLFDLGAGSKLRPARIVAVKGSKVVYLDMESGNTGTFTKNKTVRAIKPKGEINPEASKATPKDPDVAAAEGAFSLDDYIKGPEVLLAEVGQGDLFLLQGKAYKKLPGGLVKNMTTGQEIPDGSDKPAANTVKLTLLVPKAGNETPADQLTKGDHTKLAALGVGDQYQTTVNGPVFQITRVSVADEDSEPKIKAAPVLSNGELGLSNDTSPDVYVIFAGKAGDAPAGEVDTATLPDADFKGYASKWGSGGKYQHPFIKDIPEGTHIRDTSGKEWIVKQSGVQAVISDGEANYAVSGSLRARVLEKHNLVDKAPALGTVGEAPGPVTWPEQVKQQWDIPVGTQFTSSGGIPWEVIEGHKIKSLNDGSVGDLYAGAPIPSSWKPKHIGTVEAPSSAAPDAPDMFEEEGDPIDAYLNDDMWPDDVPLPEPGATVWFTAVGGSHKKGLVTKVAGDIYTISPLDSAPGETVDIPVEDLLRPASPNNEKMMDTSGPQVGDMVVSNEQLDSLPVGSRIAHTSPQYAEAFAFKKLPNGKWEKTDGAVVSAVSIPKASGGGDVYGITALGATDEDQKGWEDALNALPVGAVIGPHPDYPTNAEFTKQPDGTWKGKTASFAHEAGAFPVSQYMVVSYGPAGQASSDPLNPFKSNWGSGGKYKHHPIGDLAVGTWFTDKSGTAYKVTGSGAGHNIAFEDESGQQFQTHAANKVKLIDAPTGDAPPKQMPEAPTPEPDPVAFKASQQVVVKVSASAEPFVGTVLGPAGKNSFGDQLWSIKPNQPGASVGTYSQLVVSPAPRAHADYMENQVVKAANLQTGDKIKSLPNTPPYTVMKVIPGQEVIVDDQNGITKHLPFDWEGYFDSHAKGLPPETQEVEDLKDKLWGWNGKGKAYVGGGSKGDASVTYVSGEGYFVKQGPDATPSGPYLDSLDAALFLHGQGFPKWKGVVSPLDPPSTDPHVQDPAKWSVGDVLKDSSNIEWEITSVPTSVPGYFGLKSLDNSIETSLHTAAILNTYDMKRVATAKADAVDDILPDVVPGTLEPYGSPYGSGGKYKHHKIDELEPLDKFRDKSGATFTFIGMVGDNAHYTDEAGTLFSVPKVMNGKPTRVRKVEKPAAAAPAPAPASDGVLKSVNDFEELPAGTVIQYGESLAKYVKQVGGKWKAVLGSATTTDVELATGAKGWKPIKTAKALIDSGALKNGEHFQMPSAAPGETYLFVADGGAHGYGYGVPEGEGIAHHLEADNELIKVDAPEPKPAGPTAAEKAGAKGWKFVWAIDPDAEWPHENESPGAGMDPWSATLYDADGNVLDDLHGIWLQDGPESDPYATEVEGELYDEAESNALPDVPEQKFYFGDLGPNQKFKFEGATWKTGDDPDDMTATVIDAGDADITVGEKATIGTSQEVELVYDSFPVVGDWLEVTDIDGEVKAGKITFDDLEAGTFDIEFPDGHTIQVSSDNEYPVVPPPEDAPKKKRPKVGDAITGSSVAAALPIGSTVGEGVGKAIWQKIGEDAWAMVGGDGTEYPGAGLLPTHKVISVGPPKGPLPPTKATLTVPNTKGGFTGKLGKASVGSAFKVAQSGNIVAKVSNGYDIYFADGTHVHVAGASVASDRAINHSTDPVAASKEPSLRAGVPDVADMHDDDGVPGPDAPTAIPDYNLVPLELQGAKGAGGTQGAKWATHKTSGKKWLVKQYNGNEDRVATELLGNAIYAVMGAKVAPAGKWTNPDTGKVALTYEGLDGAPKHISSPSADLGEHFMTDALLANWDFIGASHDNILWGPDGKPFRVDQGGVLFYRAQGSKKDYLANAVPEIVTMLKPPGGQGAGTVAITQKQMVSQAQDIGSTLTDAVIDSLVDSAPFATKKLREDTREALKGRVKMMKKIGLGGTDGLPDWIKKNIPHG